MDQPARTMMWLTLSIFCLSTMATGHVAWAQQPEDAPVGEAMAAAPDDVDIEVIEPQDPAVLAVLETNPTTPSELVRAAKILADLDRADLAKDLLVKLIEDNPDEAQLAALGERFGSAMFIGLATKGGLQPEAKQVADAVLKAMNRQYQDSERIASLIAKLQAPTSEERGRALVELRKGRGAAISALIGVLANDARLDEHAMVRAALVKMGDEAVAPLLAVVNQRGPDNTRVVVEAIRILSVSKARGIPQFLIGPAIDPHADVAVRDVAKVGLIKMIGSAPTRFEGISVLADRTVDYLEGGQPVPTVLGENSLEGRLTVAAQLARDAYRAAPNDARIRRLYLVSSLEASEDESVIAEGAFKLRDYRNTLEYAMSKGHLQAATRSARQLGKIGAADELLYGSERPSILAQAARHSNRRLRMVAVDAILAMQPTDQFAGSSYVTDALGFFVATSGAPRVLIVGPSTEASRRLVGGLAAQGYEVDTAVTGREAVRLAASSPDYELALIDSAVASPTMGVLVQQLRNEWRTADLRVGLIARPRDFDRAKKIAEPDPMTLAFYRPTDEETIAWQLGKLEQLGSRTFVDHVERQQQAAAALAHLAELAELDEKVFNTSRLEERVLAALYVPALTPAVVAVLKHSGTHRSQRVLVDLASRHTQPVAIRRAATAAFIESIEKHRILLTTEEINRQYERYNASEHLDVATQKLLGLVLDAIEAPSRAPDSTVATPTAAEPSPAAPVAKEME